MPFENVIWLGKEYSTSKTVEQELSGIGVHVVPTSQSLLGHYDENFKNAVDSTWEIARQRLRGGGIKAVLVLDDGGQLISAIPASVREAVPIVAVEQTMSGVKAARAPQPSLPVIEVGASAAKKIFESPLIAEAVVRKASSTAFGSIIPTTVGVVGYGSIGKALSKFLAERCGVTILAADPAISSLEDSGSIKLVSMRELFSSAKLVFGCSGTDITNHSGFPMDLLEGVTLASCSSRDVEFKSLLRRYSGLSSTVISADGEVCCKLNAGHFSVLRRGFPVNFDGSEESVPTEMIQLTTGLLFAGLIQAREMFATGLYPAKGVMLDPYLQAGILNAWNRKTHGLSMAREFGLDMGMIRYVRTAETLAEQSEGVECKLKGCEIIGSDIHPIVRQQKTKRSGRSFDNPPLPVLITRGAKTLDC